MNFVKCLFLYCLLASSIFAQESRALSINAGFNHNMLLRSGIAFNSKNSLKYGVEYFYKNYAFSVHYDKKGILQELEFFGKSIDMSMEFEYLSFAGRYIIKLPKMIFASGPVFGIKTRSNFLLDSKPVSDVPDVKNYRIGLLLQSSYRAQENIIINVIYDLGLTEAYSEKTQISSLNISFSYFLF